MALLTEFPSGYHKPEALNKSFTVASAAAVHIDASELNADIHASAAYRANLISVQTQRAVAQCLA